MKLEHDSIFSGSRLVRWTVQVLARSLAKAGPTLTLEQPAGVPAGNREPRQPYLTAKETMKKGFARMLGLLWLAAVTLSAQEPSFLNYEGRVTANGVNFKDVGAKSDSRWS